MRISMYEEEPEEEPDEEPEAAQRASAAHVPSVSDRGREWEYRVELLTVAEIIDGKTLAAHLTEASGDGWDFIQVIDAGERRAMVFRKPKPPRRQERTVGFVFPART